MLRIRWASPPFPACFGGLVLKRKDSSAFYHQRTLNVHCPCSTTSRKSRPGSTPYCAHNPTSEAKTQAFVS
jgi:hypothetical protein